MANIFYLRNPAAGLYPEWQYEAEIAITNPASVANFQHTIALAWQFGMNWDFSDIRFTTLDGMNCPYWIETYTSKTTATVWIKVPLASQSIIKILWGNGCAKDASSGADTFIAYHGAATTAFHDTTPTVPTPSPAIVWESRAKATAASHTLAFGAGEVANLDSSPSADSFCLESSTWGSCVYFKVFNNGTQQYKSGGSAFTSGTYYRLKINIIASNKFQGFVDGVQIGTDITTGGPDEPVMLTYYPASGTGAQDWSFIRLYTATEPTLALTATSIFTRVQPMYALQESVAESCSFGVSYGFTGAANAEYNELGTFNVNYGFLGAAEDTKVMSAGTLGSLVIGGSSRRDLSGKTWVARARYAKGTTGGINSSIFDQAAYITCPDHNGVTRCIWSGFFPSQIAQYIPANNSEEFIGYDYAQKLSGQVLPDYLLEILAPNDQEPVFYQRLDIDAVVHPFHRGKIITGATSGAVARVAATPGTWLYSADLTESYLVQGNEIVLSNIAGTFQDDEVITETGGSGEAYVDGAIMPLDFGVSTYYPEIWLRHVLGGDNWQNTTGIYPYRLNPVGTISGSWTPKPYDTWFFESAETKQQAIEQLAAYHNFIFLVKWKDIGLGGYTPVAYFVHQDDIDISGGAATEHQGLDLPAMVTITNPDIYLDGNITMSIVGEGRINQVIIRCQDTSGNWYENTRVPTTTESYGVYWDEEIPIQYYKEDPNLTSQDDCDTAAALLYTYLSNRMVTYQAAFIQRTDFELLQLLNFSGYTEIPDGQYRIIGIEYEFRPALVIVHTTLIPQSQFKASLNINRMYINSTLEVQRIIRAEMAKQKGVTISTVTEVSAGNEVTSVTESGVIIKSRIKS